MPTSQKIVWAGLAVTVVAILVLGYFLFLAPEKKEPLPVIPETSSLAGTRAEAAGAGEESDPAIVPLDLPLDESDAPVRAMVAAAEIPAAMKDWLRQKEIVRTVVAVVDNIAQGQSPAALLPFLAPPGKFTASEKDGVILLDPASFRRYDLLVSTITAVADKTWVTWYQTLRPTLERAFAELGYPGITFGQRLRQAIEQLTRVPLLPEKTVLEKKVLSYAFADAELEALNPAQKHLLRLGPVHAARLQNKLRTLAALLKNTGKN